MGRGGAAGLSAYHNRMMTEQLGNDWPSRPPLPRLSEEEDSHEPPHQPLALPPQYRLHANILAQTAISENMRARLRSFLISESSKQWMLRETCALACCLLDLYFMRGGVVAVQDFQNLAIACLILAAKLREGKFPTISFHIFNKEELLACEKRVARRLAYCLNPPTHYAFAELATANWDQFALRSSCKCFGQQSDGVNTKLRAFHEQLDCSLLVLRSLEPHPEQLVLNLFYLHARQLHHPVPEPHKLTDPEFLLTFYAPHSFRELYDEFLTAHSRARLDEELGTYLKQFMGLGAGNAGWPIRSGSEVIDRLRVFDRLQTVPRENYALAKGVIERANRRQ